MKRLAVIILLSAIPLPASAGNIDRKAVVDRHDILVTGTQGKSPAQVGNGKFAFGMDVTGLQTFTPFNTLSDWGWHSVPLPEGKSLTDYKPTYIESYGRDIPYLLEDPDEPELSQWLKWNPHRVNLGRIGFILLKGNGEAAVEEDIEEPVQHVGLWTGLVTSSFSLDGVKVEVRTSCHSESDIIGVSVKSELIAQGRLKIFFDFPYALKKEFQTFAGDYTAVDRHSTTIILNGGRRAVIEHSMDDLRYCTSIVWKGRASLSHERDHRYVLSPAGKDRFSFTACFGMEGIPEKTSAAKVARSQASGWKRFWKSGAAIDLSGSRDERWMELERRVVLSQYLMRMNESGLYPPQEEGLVNNGWHGRFHWEMIWWHAAHWMLWDRGQYCSRYIDIYNQFMPEAVRRAESEGRKGAKWPKCTGNINREWPCDTHAMLCWQQPHPIYLAEMDRRNNPGRETMDKWKDIVTASADYMADLVFWDDARGEYVLGPPVRVLSENIPPLTTINPVFELGYFRYGLRTALEWAEMLGLPESRTGRWRDVLENLAPLPVEDGCYKTSEDMKDMWEKYNFEHPGLTGVYGWLPGDGVDTDVFRSTFYKVLDQWQMDKVWGWDFPMMAMAAARLGDPETAVDLLTTTEHKFNFDVHGLADTWPFPYFPANGGLLSAMAMMCGGWDGGPDSPAPGFPQDGSWTVRYEGFKKMQ